MYVYIYMYIYMYMYAYIYMSLRCRTCFHTLYDGKIYIHVYTYIHIYIYMYIYFFASYNVLLPWLAADAARVSHVLSHVV